MEEVGRDGRLRSDEGFAHAQISIISQDNIPLLVIHRERILRVRTGKTIKRRIDPRYDEKKANAQKSESF
jgi:hypothetical protein